MGDAPRPAAGTIVWTNLTVPDAAGVRNFYAAVVGWSPGEVDVDASAARCVELGGEVIVGPGVMGGHGRYYVIRDPAGAFAALFQAAE